MDAAESLDLYCAAWNEPDADKRRALLEKAWSDDGTYCDPTADVAGRQALVDHIGSVFEMFGHYRMQRTSGYDQHHDYVRFTWDMQTESGEPLVDGFDVARLAQDGRIDSILGFFGPFPA